MGLLIYFVLSKFIAAASDGQCPFGFGVPIVGLFIWLIVISADGPGPEVISGRQLKAKYVEFALNEDLLNPDEQSDVTVVSYE